MGIGKIERLANKLESAINLYNSEDEESISYLIPSLREASKEVFDYIKAKKRDTSEVSRKIEKRGAYLIEASEYIEANKKYLTDVLKALNDLAIKGRNKIWTDHTFIVKYIAKRYARIHHPQIPYKDIYQEGNIGLLRAIERYDPNKKGRGNFETFTHRRIDNSIKRSIDTRLRRIGLPPESTDDYRKEIEYFSGLFREKFKRKPSDEELAAFSGKTLRRIKDLKWRKYALQDMKSLDEPARNYDGKKTLLDFINDGNSLEDEVINQIISQELIECIKRLPCRDQRILMGRLEGKSQTEIGFVEKNLTRQRIQQIEKRAIKKLESRIEFQRLKA